MQGKLRISSHWPWLLILIGWAVIHWELIIYDRLLGRDDLPLILPLLKTASFSDYFGKLWQGVYSDLQPVRDLTFFFNILAKEWLGYGGFHLANTVLAFLILTRVKVLLELRGIEKKLVWTCLLLIAFHPLYNVAFAWVSNRKHLLAVFFILCYLVEWQKNGATNQRSLLYILLSILSQPITVFIPLIKEGFQFLQTKRWTPLSVVSVIVTLSLFCANYAFYKLLPIFAARNVVESLAPNAEWVTRMARVFAQIFVPLSFAVEYDSGSYLALVGLAIGCIYGLLFYRERIKDRPTLVLLIMVTSSLFPVLSWGPRDAYLILFLCFSICSAIIFWGQAFRGNRGYAVLPVIFLLAFQSNRFVEMWKSDLKLYSMSYSIEGGAINQLAYAHALRRVQPELAYRLSVDLRDKYPNGFSYQLIQLVTESYYLSTYDNVEEKLKIYRGSESLDTYHLFFKAKFLADHGHEHEAAEVRRQLKEIIANNKAERDILLSAVCLDYLPDCTTLGF